jgi:flagellin-like hook-associated protein FlgL
MAVTSDRVGTYSQRSYLLNQLMNVQKRLNDTQTQVNTEKKSQNYEGIYSDSFRLVSMENEASRLDQFQQTNTIAMSRLETMMTSVDAVDQSVRDFRSMVLFFSQTDMSSPLSADDLSKINDIQEQAFQALKDMEYYLNTSHDGRYLFAGGKTDTIPVSFPFDTLDDFQAVYDGTDVLYPQSRTAALDNTKVNADMDFDTAGTITGAAGTFITDAFDETTVPSTLAVAGQTITSSAGTPFSGLSAGDVIRLDDGGNSAFLTIESVGAGGGSLTFTSEPDLTGAGFGPTLTNWDVTVPAFSPGQVSITNAGANNGTYRVTDISADGSTLTVDPAPVSTASSTGVSAAPNVYYQGDELTYSHRLDDSRSIEVGITAKDPAFEKAIRAMAIIAQGGLDQHPERAEEALDLLSDALDHSPANTNEMSSDLNDVAQLIGLNLSSLNTVITEQEDYQVFLETRISDLENVDKTEALVRLSDDAQALETSYATFARISSLTLNDYI